ncbi:MAG: type II toxin-antitoxin system death-on-curing family toxin [Alphaproteobacteria bacterium]|nr:type II toxin-antitoxin system death-on-curing family toxin [Alphaproteobacteria bacterium]
MAVKRTPTWLRRDVVIAIHAAQIAEHGGKPGTRDTIALDTALGRPAEFFTNKNPPLPDLAAAYTGSVMRKLPFLDGNKRMAFLCALLFLRVNGLFFNGSTGESVAIMLRFAKGRASENDLAEFFRLNSAPYKA